MTTVTLTTIQPMQVMTTPRTQAMIMPTMPVMTMLHTIITTTIQLTQSMLTLMTMHLARVMTTGIHTPLLWHSVQRQRAQPMMSLSQRSRAGR